LTGGRLEDALTYYKRSKDFGVERAALHIRNVRLSSVTPHGPPQVHQIQVSAKIFGKKMKEVENNQVPE
jgi:hypothetical protein